MKYNKIILNIPHSSKQVPTQYIKDYIDREEKMFTINNLTDHYTDDLFGGNDNEGVEKYIYPYSRVFCDVERFNVDDLEPMSEKGMGMYYTKGLNDITFRDKNDITLSAVESSYNNYHSQLRGSIQSSNEKGDKPLIIDCHSFSDKRFVNDGVIDDSKPFPDICIGYNNLYGYNKETINLISNVFKNLGYTVKLNYPYNGSIYYGDLEHDTVMIEINKRLYLDKDNNKKPDYYKVKNLITHVINKLLKDVDRKE